MPAPATQATAITSAASASFQRYYEEAGPDYAAWKITGRRASTTRISQPTQGKMNTPQTKSPPHFDELTTTNGIFWTAISRLCPATAVWFDGVPRI